MKLNLSSANRNVSIIDASDEAFDRYGWMYGSSTVIIQQEHIDALHNGKALAFNDGEYVTFLVFDDGVSDLPRSER